MIPVWKTKIDRLIHLKVPVQFLSRDSHFHESDLRFGSVREVDGAPVTVIADQRERAVRIHNAEAEWMNETAAFSMVRMPSPVMRQFAARC